MISKKRPSRASRDPPGGTMAQIIQDFVNRASAGGGWGAPWAGDICDQRAATAKILLQVLYLLLQGSKDAVTRRCWQADVTARRGPACAKIPSDRRDHGRRPEAHVDQNQR
jgi:hypothetical protein